jgi:hypothetical protein
MSRVAFWLWCRLGWRGRARLSSWPSLYLPLYRRVSPKPELAISSDTELVIEGFPRSANTYAVVAFEAVQSRQVHVAHHVHAPAQLLAAAKRGIPAIALVREPAQAVASLVLRESDYSLERGLVEYRRFYQPLLSHRDAFVIGSFDDVTTRYGRVIEEVNAKFGTNFVTYEPTAELEARVTATIERLEYDEALQRVDEAKVARPSETRHQAAQGLRRDVREADGFEAAEAVYRAFVDPPS